MDEKELKEIEELEKAGVLKSPQLNDLVSLAVFWEEKGKSEKRIASNLAGDERYGEAQAFNSRGEIWLKASEKLIKMLQD
jgi:hypothetical protein